jgi:DNA processing protein
MVAMTCSPEERLQGAAARDRAVWLAELATWRRGLIGFLVSRCGGMDEALALNPSAVAAAARARRQTRPAARESERAGVRAGRRDSAPGPAADRHAEAVADDSLFAAILARGPVAGSAARPDVVTWLDPAYPPQLRDLPDPPPALFLSGIAGDGLRALAERHVVAVVGSRSPSAYGREMARAIARDLAATGVLVVSGLALGIDAVAHEAALDAVARRDAVSTVAVLGCGADVEHPPSNRRLFARVRAGGLLVSEFSWGVGARPWRFPARNRVMAGLSEAVVAVEGAERSGALITARYALDLGRDVLAVPGEAGRRLSAGPHRLLRQGAAVCESARDVLEVLGYGELALGWKGREPLGGSRADAGEGDPDAGEGDPDAGEGDPDAGEGDPDAGGSDADARADRRLVRALDDGVQTVDHLASAAGMDVAATLARLAVLEVDGAVEAFGGGAYRLRRGA